MDDNIKVTVSCGTKFHSDYMAFQLNKHGMLKQVLTSHPARYYLSRVPIIRSKVKFLPPVFLLSYGFRKVFGNSSKMAKWLNYKLPLLYDFIAAKSVKSTDVLLTWAWSGLNTIQKVKKNGGVTIVEECGSCSRFQNEILKEEYTNLGLEFNDETPDFIVERQLLEAQLADYVLCPSTHVAQSFIKYGIPKAKCKVIPYGANINLFKPNHAVKKEFRIMFVGSVGVRKGLIYLFKALEVLQKDYDIKCTIIGQLEEQFKPIFEQYVHLFTYIAKVPHKELVNYYNQGSVFVFPSLDEGMAYVQLEALASGLPVICTMNSGGDSVVEEGKEGFVVPIRNHEVLVEKLKILYNDPVLLQNMAENARTKALTFSWDSYGDQLSQFIKSIKVKN
jgi:glycosyltransferase involved in cell wall biosynthesis